MIRIILADWRNRQQHLVINRFRLSYWRQGQGPSLLLLHGFPTSSWDWQALWPELTTRYQVLAMDFLGFGFSDKPYPHRYTIVEQADLVEKLCSELGISECRILAHDFGDSVAQELLARMMSRQTSLQISAITFLNGGLFPETHRPVLAQRLLLSPLGPLIAKLMQKRTLQRNFRRIFGAGQTPTTEEIDGFWLLISLRQGKQVIPAIIRYMRERKVHRDRWLQAMQQSPIPLRLINGIDDPVSGRHLVDRYRQLIQHADVVELPGIGHYPQWEAPDAVLKQLLP